MFCITNLNYISYYGIFCTTDVTNTTYRFFFKFVFFSMWHAIWEYISLPPSEDTRGLRLWRGGLKKGDSEVVTKRNQPNHND